MNLRYPALQRTLADPGGLPPFVNPLSTPALH